MSKWFFGNTPAEVYAPEYSNIYNSILRQKRQYYYDAHGRWPEQEYAYNRPNLAEEAKQEAISAVRQLRGFND